MNPFPIAWAFARANGGTSVLFLLLIAIATALGIAITSQERALREGSARAADPFDIVIAAPGSQTDLLMNVVYLRPSAVPLVPPEISLRILGEPRARLVAPLAFGDNYQGLPIVGTIAPLLEHMADGIPLEGRMFESDVEAVLGSAVPHPIGHQIAVAHGLGAINEGSHGSITAVGRMPPTGTAWDRAILVPIEFSWLAHNLTTGHPPGSDQIGPPWDPASLPGVPAFVVVADSLIAAYGLRQQYRTAETTAFFPAEVLVELYALLGDVRSLMGLLSLATQALVVAAILTGVMALMQLYRTRLAVLRALGATRVYVIAVMWCYVMGLIACGALLGLGLGIGVARTISARLEAEAGIPISPTIGGAELLLLGGLLILGAVMALIPAWLLFRRPAVTWLRG